MRYHKLTPQKRAERIFQFGLDHNLEIVSHGLAPNPNGFCFEIHEPRAADLTIRAFSKQLDQLDTETNDALKRLVFG